MEDMRAMGVSGSGTHDEIRSVASDRARWRQLVAQCPAGTGGPKSKSKSKVNLLLEFELR